MIYVPQALEATVRRWVGSYQEAWQLMEKVSQSCLQRFLRGKREVREAKRQKAAERGKGR
jgi:hypothetical protein